MAKIIKALFQLKRGAASTWELLNPVLSAGEPGFEIDTGKLKIGDGKTQWNSLSYFNDNAKFTHKWDGTTLTITTPDGTSSSVDLRGEQGAQGAAGPTGNGIVSINNTNTEGLVDTYTILFDNGTTTTFTVTNGKDGEQGDQGPRGEAGTGVAAAAINGSGELVLSLTSGEEINLGNVVGAQGAEGPQGRPGEPGPQGTGITDITITEEGQLSITLSSGETTSLGNVKGPAGAEGIGIAEIYISNGNLYVRKTNEDVAVNLGQVKGADGQQGPAGPDGPAGANGESAYELYKQAYPDYTGSLTDWLNSLKGETGPEGPTGKDYVLTEADKQEIAALVVELVNKEEIARLTAVLIDTQLLDLLGTEGEA